MDKMIEKKKLRHSLASTVKDGEGTCDLEKLANILKNTTGVPERINLTKATEISLLARHYLWLLDKHENGGKNAKKKTIKRRKKARSK